METIRSYNDFTQFIDNTYSLGHKLCLEGETLGHANWPPERFISYLETIDRDKEELGISINYQSEADANGNISIITVYIHFSENENRHEHIEGIKWIVK